jgi:hypothetical protein
MPLFSINKLRDVGLIEFVRNGQLCRLVDGHDGKQSFFSAAVDGNAVFRLTGSTIIFWQDDEYKKSYINFSMSVEVIRLAPMKEKIP